MHRSTTFNKHKTLENTEPNLKMQSAYCTFPPFLPALMILTMSKNKCTQVASFFDYYRKLCNSYFITEIVKESDNSLPYNTSQGTYKAELNEQILHWIYRNKKLFYGPMDTLNLESIVRTKEHRKTIPNPFFFPFSGYDNSSQMHSTWGKIISWGINETEKT